jgi:hypothetical protein
VKLADTAHEDVEGYLGAVLARWRPATAHNDRALRVFYVVRMVGKGAREGALPLGRRTGQDLDQYSLCALVASRRRKPDRSDAAGRLAVPPEAPTLRRLGRRRAGPRSPSTAIARRPLVAPTAHVPFHSLPDRQSTVAGLRQPLRRCTAVLGSFGSRVGAEG